MYAADADSVDPRDRDAVLGGRHYWFLYRIAREWINNSAPLDPAVGPEDVTQEMVAQAVREYGKFDPTRGKLTTWLGLIARRTIRNLRETFESKKRGGNGRGSNRDGRVLVVPLQLNRSRQMPDAKAGPQSPPTSDFWNLVGRSLTAAEARVVEMRFRQDLTFTEIGERCGFSKNWAHKLCFDALAKLHRERHRLVRAAG